MLSLCLSPKKETKKNKQKAVGGKSCSVTEKLEVVTPWQDNQTIDGETIKVNGGESEALEPESARLTTEQSAIIGHSPELEPLNPDSGLKLGKVQNWQSSSSDGNSGDTQAVAQKLVNSSAHGNKDFVAVDKLIQERSKFLNGLGIEIPDKLAELMSKTTIEQLNNLRQLLKENKTLNNPVGFLIKALKNNWEPKHKPSTPTKPSWHDEFEEFYNQAIEAGYCEDLPINYLSRNHRNEPMVRVNRPWNGAPYTLLYWREAMQEFWGKSRRFSNEL